jgi:hypothetical protein
VACAIINGQGTHKIDQAPMMNRPNYEELFRILTARYQGADPEALLSVLCPITIPIHTLNKEVFKEKQQTHYKASFSIELTPTNQEILTRGRTGKFVPKEYVEDKGVWQELAKGRIIQVDREAGKAYGEVYVGGTKTALVKMLTKLSSDDYLEIDQYGAAAKVLSGLVEYSLAKLARESGYIVRRMPEDMARHLGSYYHYDFEFENAGVIKKIEVKSLWGTDTRYARLIRSKTKEHLTSSCKFTTQDIFAVSLFLRTGNIQDFAFARSVPRDEKPYGLPRASTHPEYVHQNPFCTVGNGSWFATIGEVWNLE